MKYQNCFLLVSLIFWGCTFQGEIRGQVKTDFVNPFIGTAPSNQFSMWDGHGRTYPGAVAPNGFVQLTPETGVAIEKGYDYRDSTIGFFSCMGHFSGYPNGSSGWCHVMPVEHNPDFQIYRDGRPFSHEHEKAVPGYYKVVFNDNSTTVEATATPRAGFFRFHITEKVKPCIFVGDIGRMEWGPGPVIKGSRRNTILAFNRQWLEVKQVKQGLVLVFDKKDRQSLQLKISSSTVGFENARDNLEQEMDGWDFDRFRQMTRNSWERELSAVEIRDGCPKDKVMFYTALYHSLLMPWVVSDANGTYRGPDQKVHQAKGEAYYGGFSPWDTFRSLHPLLCIIAPEKQNDMVRSLLAVYEQTGRLPAGPMTGFHSVPIIVDTYFKNNPDLDKMTAWKAMEKCLLTDLTCKPDMAIYAQKGFVPAYMPESVTRTVEYAYDDWVLSRFAGKVMNRRQDFRQLQKRSFNYRNLFDPQQNFLVPRGDEGFVRSVNHVGFKEGDKWNYSFFVPHNPRDLIHLMGGDSLFVNHLDTVLRQGKILFDNEPDFHIPYLFNAARCPSKTQGWVSAIMESHFNDGPGGLPGNDDLGSMSSWFVFNAMGFYPVCPGNPEYYLGSPLFREIAIRVGEDQRFVIHAQGKTPENRYIQSCMLNQIETERSWLSHSVLMDGGSLILEMGSEPSLWGKNPDREVYSLTRQEPVIALDTFFLSEKEVVSDEWCQAVFRLKNTGSAGTLRMELLANGEPQKNRNILVEPGKTITDSISFRLYSPGTAEMMFRGFSPKLTLKVRSSGEPTFEYRNFAYESLVQAGGVQPISFDLKNRGGNPGSARFTILLNNELVFSGTRAVDPGETIRVRYSLKDLLTGENTVVVDNLSGTFKVVEEPLDAILADLSFKNRRGNVLMDKSGFSNDGIIRDSSPENENEGRQEDDFFVEIPSSKSLMALDSALTLMCWVNFSRMGKNPVSIITRGDYHVIQVLPGARLEFFAGGWGRGVCQVQLPSGITGEWYHLAGVCDGKSLKFYLDGELKGKKELARMTPLASEGKWMLGRNEEFPGERIFHGKIDGVKIIAAALSPQEIQNLMNSKKPGHSKECPGKDKN